MSDLTTLTGQLAGMKQRMIDRLTAQGVSGYTMQDTMDDIVTAYNRLQALNYQTTTITENGSYMSDPAYTGYNNFIVNVPAGGPVSHKKYNLLDRVREDLQGDTIGTVVGFHYDANNIEYAVVCLDAVYRLAQGQNLSTGNIYINTFPGYLRNEVYNAKETATFNCDKMMEWVNAAEGRSSTGVQHCRSKVFMIGGDVYAGQLPTYMELIMFYQRLAEINSLDVTVADNPSLAITASTNMWSSTQYHDGNSYNYAFATYPLASSQHPNRSSNYFIAPVLEIPNEVISE